MEQWEEHERDIINRFFHEEVPEAFGNKFPMCFCTEQACIGYAKAIMKTDDIAPVKNQGSNSFTLRGSTTVVQFRLKSFNLDVLKLATMIYGELVPEVTEHEWFLLPTYSSKLIPGQLHLLQSFPAEFLLEREKQTVTELGAFVARTAFFEQPKTLLENNSWTKSAPGMLDLLAENPSLEINAPELLDMVRDLQLNVDLLETLPMVLTHHDFSQVNILVSEAGNVTGVLDVDEARIEAFGMCIWGLYEGFFGSMEDGRWSFYEEMPLLADAFWGSLWANVPSNLKQRGMEKR
ncbi:hypothetical protein N7493_006946 [Penicillium malachiteum]|uniref:Aminoglycoside phosphotransferase domain-containing protein n=1 Tax=Penicillium malachiteum TaxID=1324776 RepID=A0AAD6MV17_9EURO|nr:hypothetical protein N7493_006946 [Penicillium malachiteum]